MLTGADALDELSDDGRIYRLMARELGEEMAGAFVLARDTQERWERRRHPDDGLRERKKRRTRQQISDVATHDSRMRHIEQGLRGGKLRAAVLADLERASRLLETGLRSFI